MLTTVPSAYFVPTEVAYSQEAVYDSFLISPVSSPMNEYVQPPPAQYDFMPVACNEYSWMQAPIHRQTMDALSMTMDNMPVACNEYSWMQAPIHRQTMDALSMTMDNAFYMAPVEAQMPPYGKFMGGVVEAQTPCGTRTDGALDKTDASGECSDAGSTMEAPTTMMIMNIPCRFGKDAIEQAIASVGFAGTYDFIYIPKRKSTPVNGNIGYCFVNFLSAEDAESFVTAFGGYQFAGNSVKRCAIKVAHQQGIDALVANAQRQAAGNMSCTPHLEGLYWNQQCVLYEGCL